MNTDPNIFEPQVIENTQVVVIEGSDLPPSAPLECAPVDPEPDDFGPDRERFTELQRRFIREFVANGGDGSAAAVAAGYGGGASGMAIRNLAKQRIQAEIVRRIRLQSGSALAIAVGRLMKIAETSTDDRAAVAAALGLMDRFGMAPPKGPSVNVQVNNNFGNSEAQSILTEVVQRREQRLKRVGPSALSGIAGTMPDIPPPSEG